MSISEEKECVEQLLVREIVSKEYVKNSCPSSSAWFSRCACHSEPANRDQAIDHTPPPLCRRPKRRLWQLLCREIKAMSHPMLSYIEEVDVLNGLEHTVSKRAG